MMHIVKRESYLHFACTAVNSSVSVAVILDYFGTKILDEVGFT